MEEISKSFDEFEVGTRIFLNVRSYVENKESGETKLKELSLRTFILDENIIDERIKNFIPKGFRICSDIKVDGYLITFDKQGGAAIDMVVALRSANFRFRRVSVRTIVLKEKKYLIVGTKDKGVKFNLRKAFRVGLDSYAYVALLPSMVQKDCRVKDLSSTGIGLEVEASYGIALGDELEIQFSFENKDLAASLTLYTIRAKVIRIVSLEEEKDYLGCTITKKDIAIDRLVMLKQRDEVRKLIK